MEVTSIADYDRAREMHLDEVLDSAVTQLEALADPDFKRRSMAELMYRFGEMQLDKVIPQHFFNFELPTTTMQWPGPRFETALHKVIRHLVPPPKSSKASKKHGHDDVKQGIQPRKAPKPKAVKPKRVTSTERKLIIAVASRDPPLQLLDLPPEIRNTIWSMLSVFKRPLEAQLRRIRPCRKVRGGNRGVVIRRFPQEPVLAAVNHQLRREVLSIFYGCNNFIFEKHTTDMFKDLSMTNPTVLQKWKPHPQIAAFLCSIDLRFNTTDFRSLNRSAVYTLRRQGDGQVVIDVKPDRSTPKRVEQATDDDYCVCTESLTLRGLKGIDHSQDLIEMAIDLIGLRLAELPDSFTRAISAPLSRLLVCPCCHKGLTIYDRGI